MILKDRITVRVATTTYDGWGQPIRSYEDVDMPAQVDPTTTSDPEHLHLALEGKYRITLPPAPEFPNDSRVVWRGQDMQIEGKVQSHSINGRTHHRELIAVYTGA